MIDKLDAALSFHQAALSIRAQRQELIAANIANADTPNYKARDVDFSAALHAAMAGNSQAAPELNKTAARHLDAGVAARQGSGQPGQIQYRTIQQASVDGNTVDMDVERNQFADNAVRYEASLIMINGQIKKLMAAIQG
ncbi:MAG: flagellar basal body rod protein FlgB [Methylophilaceae bacterium]